MQLHACTVFLFTVFVDNPTIPLVFFSPKKLYARMHARAHTHTQTPTHFLHQAKFSSSYTESNVTVSSHLFYVFHPHTQFPLLMNVLKHAMKLFQNACYTNWHHYINTWQMSQNNCKTVIQSTLQNCYPVNIAKLLSSQHSKARVAWIILISFNTAG
jgi:hypothetical protein